ncbi:MAG: hypothetical protein ABSB59_35700 [Streptosporangiaceae bacterium]
MPGDRRDPGQRGIPDLRRPAARARAPPQARVAQTHWTEIVLVHLDTPLPLIEERRAANSRTRARTSMPEGKMRQDISLLKPPGDTERPIRVSPGYVRPEVLAKVSARLKKN